MGAAIHYLNVPPFITTLTGNCLTRGICSLIFRESISVDHPLINALAGIAYVLMVKSGWNMALQGGELEVISCAVIGGTLLTGGVGYMVGAMFGALLLFIVIQRAVVSYTGRKKK